MRENLVEKCIREHLKNTGWDVNPRLTKRGIDIEATQGNRYAIIEVKGCGAHNTAMSNNFYSVLGQILKDMTNIEAEYYVAFPKIEPYIRLWNSFPQLAKDKTGIKVIFVEENGSVIGIQTTKL